MISNKKNLIILMFCDIFKAQWVEDISELN